MLCYLYFDLDHNWYILSYTTILLHNNVKQDIMKYCSRTVLNQLLYYHLFNLFFYQKFICFYEFNKYCLVKNRQPYHIHGPVLTLTTRSEGSFDIILDSFINKPETLSRQKLFSINTIVTYKNTCVPKISQLLVINHAKKTHGALSMEPIRDINVYNNNVGKLINVL